ncbi:MAG: pyruvate ferredoxin oxidoreductase subunit gamma [Candidatus Aenigmarchaeota archaeon]|nr:pyruvate ferredoxin oxidoreductase subunit gamma [Candidatus Aenigmarchaeota archaeon]
MIEVRFHGRGGQGVVTSAYLLALAAFKEGKFCQAFPFFGTERRGAPVTSFARIDKKFIRTRERVYNPDYVVVLDSTLLDVVDVDEGIKERGMIIINTNKDVNLQTKATVKTVDATDIALRVIGKPFVNTSMIGALVGATGIVKLESVIDVIRERFPEEIANKNIEAEKQTYEKIRG